MEFKNTIPANPEDQGKIFRRRLLALSVAAPLVLGYTAYGDHLMPVPSDPKTVTDTLPAYYDKDCDIIPEETINETRAVYADAWQADEQPYTTSDELIVRREQNRLDVGAELGLTVFDYKTEFAALSKNLYADDPSAVPVAQYLESAQEFLSRYGVETSFSSDRIDSGDFDGATGASYEELIATDSLSAKQQLYGFIESIGAMPVELVEYMGLKKIVFVDIEDEKQAVGFADINTESPDTVYIDLYRSRNDVISHEMFHLWDAKVCGPLGMFQDVQYDQLNPVIEGSLSFYANTEGYYSVLGAGSKMLNEGLLNPLSVAATDEEKAAINAEIADINARTVVETDYGFTNIVEDKATMAEEMMGSFSRENIQAVESPILQQKTLLLAARLFQDAPMVVEYFARTGIQSYDPETNVLAK